MGGCQTGGDAEGVAASRGSDIYLSEQQSQEAKNYGYWCFPVLTRECRPDGAGGFLISMHLFLRQEVLQYWVCNMLRRARPRQFCQNVLPRLVCRESCAREKDAEQKPPPSGQGQESKCWH